MIAINLSIIDDQNPLPPDGCARRSPRVNARVPQLCKSAGLQIPTVVAVAVIIMLHPRHFSFSATRKIKRRRRRKDFLRFSDGAPLFRANKPNQVFRLSGLTILREDWRRCDLIPGPTLLHLELAFHRAGKGIAGFRTLYLTVLKRA